MIKHLLSKLLHSVLGSKDKHRGYGYKRSSSSAYRRPPGSSYKHNNYGKPYYKNKYGSHSS
ncbi:hypothetical protein MJA45_15105 [Paenibacillus aurantius]|uniref:Uncharacterized protein n=1 Tax=Paenibacillus aurantius TaxID=2918900 RepID=A0AA96L8H2_9BACL|nr:hypothetical protein [Paenibacillus aurantius]WNQ08976.1 hypothetical protein MJA45_15105 [Paenibacillus aurantius]